MPREHIVVHGIVQGVGFRYYTLRQAQALGVSGWARNRYDGTVEIEAEADAETLEEFIEAVREGPRFSRVTSLDRTPIAELGQKSGFQIS
ncbi:MAG: acylphosphatase [Candidatus Sumerlaeota bacterium]|nr:acylphosphatase [Candidatus Sumerlaeota bacterium]